MFLASSTFVALVAHRDCWRPRMMKTFPISLRKGDKVSHFSFCGKQEAPACETFLCSLGKGTLLCKDFEVLYYNFLPVNIPHRLFLTFLVILKTSFKFLKMLGSTLGCTSYSWPMFLRDHKQTLRRHFGGM